MLLSATLSKPSADVEKNLGRNYEKIKIRAENSADGFSYFVEMFTKTQVFHDHFTEKQALDFIENHAGKTFKNCTERTDKEEITILSNKKGKITRLTKAISDKKLKLGAESTKTEKLVQGEKSIPGGKSIFDGKSIPGEKSYPGGKFIPGGNSISGAKISLGSSKKKNYILQEGNPVPFLVLLGIMNSDGKVIASKYDKFRQINRFLEFINDAVNEICSSKKELNQQDEQFSQQDARDSENQLHIVDFGCGKSYLTFAVHYFLTEIRKIPCKIEGLDLKEDVINYCNQITQKLELKNLNFKIGNIADYSEKEAPDIVITLHACDTATDFALQYAVSRGARAILSVPCCQHQINTQITANKELLSQKDGLFSPLLKWGIIREKFSALLTDALRGEWLEQQGYKVQLLEFIDMEHTPKNILIRAIKKNANKATGETKMLTTSNDDLTKNPPSVINQLEIAPEIWK